MKIFWQKWLFISKKLSNILANISLSIIYLFLIAPVGIFLKIFFPNVLLGHGQNRKQNSFWLKRKKIVHDIKWAREQ